MLVLQNYTCSNTQAYWMCRASQPHTEAGYGLAAAQHPAQGSGEELASCLQCHSSPPSLMAASARADHIRGSPAPGEWAAFHAHCH